MVEKPKLFYRKIKKNQSEIPENIGYSRELILFFFTGDKKNQFESPKKLKLILFISQKNKKKSIRNSREYRIDFVYFTEDKKINSSLRKNSN